MSIDMTTAQGRKQRIDELQKAYSKREKININTLNDIVKKYSSPFDTQELSDVDTAYIPIIDCVKIEIPEENRTEFLSKVINRESATDIIICYCKDHQ